MSLLYLAQITDFQLADSQSPARFEFLEQLRGRRGAEAYLPTWRPQELLVPQAVSAMVDTLNRLPPSAETGAPLGMCISTGDSLDNAQLNELGWFLTLLAGGTLAPNSGAGFYEGVQSGDWGQELYWRPEGGPDQFKDAFGFPAHPGLLADAMRPFLAPGLAVPWLSCFGNHDGLVMGTAIPTPEYQRLLAGGEKPTDLAPGVDPLALVAEFTSHPELFLTGPARQVTPDPDRRSVGRREFVEAHLAAGGLPTGHGFDRSNLSAETTYGVFDVDGPVPIRVILLDTTNMDGDWQGSLGVRQLRWLEDKLTEVHGRYFDSQGRLVATGTRDRVVVLASHHGLVSMVNLGHDPSGLEPDQPRVTATACRSLLHRFPNVVCWLNGHRHRNDIQPRPDPAGRTAGFWEIATSAIADWPCQSRLVELALDGRGGLTIFSTMLDAAAPADPERAEGVERLAALHRELALNYPAPSFVAHSAGKSGDRNVALRLPVPFPVK